MLEILYYTATKIVRAWCGDDRQFGNFKPKKGQKVVIRDIPIPKFDSGEYKVDPTTQTIVDGNPDYVEPEPVMDYKAEILKLQDEVKKLKDKK